MIPGYPTRPTAQHLIRGLQRRVTELERRPSGSGPGLGYSTLGDGVLSAVHANANNGLMAMGIPATTGGSTTTLDTAVIATGTPMQGRPRFVRKFGGNFGGWVGAAGYQYLNTWRGFTARHLFGTVGYAAVNPMFVGLMHTAPAAPFATFTGWASVRAAGIYKPPNSDSLEWVWRIDASTTGTAPTGLSWVNGNVWALEFLCSRGTGTATATITSSAGQTATHTFNPFPNILTDPGALLAPAVMVGSGGTVTQVASMTFDSVEPW